MNKKIFLSALVTLSNIVYALNPPNTIVNTAGPLDTPSTIAIRPQGDFAYVIDTISSTPALNSLDLTNPAAPSIVGYYITFPLEPTSNLTIIPGGLYGGQYGYIGTNNGATGIIYYFAFTDPAEPSYGIFYTFPSLVTPVVTAMYPGAGYYLYVLNESSNTGYVIFYSTPESASAYNTFTTVNNPAAMAIIPSGQYAYVCDAVDNVVLVQDLTTPASPTAGNSVTINNPVAIAIHPSGNYAYVCNQSGNAVTTLNLSDPTTPVVGASVAVSNPTAIAVTPSGLYAYVCDESTNSVTALNLMNPANPTVITTVPGFSGPIALVIHPDNYYAYVANYTGNSVSTLRTVLTNAPQNVSSCMQKTIALNQPISLSNVIKWSAPASEINPPVSYNIYYDAALTELVASVPSTIYQYIDYTVNPPSNTYYVVAIDAYNNVSLAESTTVTQICSNNCTNS